MTGTRLGGKETAEASFVVEDYLKAVHEIAMQSDTRVASTGAVAERVGVSPSTVTCMFRKLAKARLLRHTAYQGVKLTDAGRSLALRVLRRHEVVETFLVEVLGLREQDVHIEAERLEHSVSEDLVSCMDEFLQRKRKAA